MLVKDPNQRYTIEQIKKHKWMLADPAVKNILAYNDDERVEENSVLDEYNEQTLELMQGLGIDIVRTKKVFERCNLRVNPLTPKLKPLDSAEP